MSELLEVFIPELRRTFKYSIPRELREVPRGIGWVCLVRHKRTHRLGVVVGRGEGRRRGDKLIGFIGGYKFPEWLFKLKDLLKERYFMSDDDFYADLLKPERLLSGLQLETSLVLSEENKYFNKVLDRLGLKRRYPVIISQDELQEKLGSRWSYYKSALINRGATVSYSLKERRGVRAELQRLIDWYKKMDSEHISNSSPTLTANSYSFLPLTLKSIRALIRKLREVIHSGGQAVIVTPERILSPPLMELSGLPEQQILHPYLSESQRTARVVLLSRGYPMLVVGTGSSLSLPAANLKLIVVLSEADDDHISDWHWRLNWREISELVAEATGAELILTDVVPSLETFSKLRAKTIELLNSISESSQRLMRKIELVPPPLRRRELLTARILDEIRETLSRGEKVLIFNYVISSSSSVCGTCGYKPTCPRCSSLLKYHGPKDNPLSGKLKCPVCGYEEKLNRCPVCGSISWHMRGVDLRNTKRLLERALETEVLLIDKELQSRKYESLKLADIKRERIIIGSKAAAKLPMAFGLIVILSISSFFWTSSPNARFNALYYLINMLNRLTPRGKLLVMEDEVPLMSRGEMRSYVHELRSWIANLSDFYSEEEALRDREGLPPLHGLIEVSIRDEGMASEVGAAALALSELIGAKVWRYPNHLLISVRRDKLPETYKLLLQLLEGFQVDLRKVRLRRAWEVTR